MRHLKRAARVVAITLMVLVAAEGVIRLTYAARNAFVSHVPLPYVIGHDYGPIPPWLEDVLILAPDRTLIWRNRPNLSRRYVDIFRPARSDDERRALFHAFLPRPASAWKNFPMWEIHLNDEGYRVAGPIGPKRLSSLRIVCLGDSWTFGMNVGDDQTYPARLEQILRRTHPARDVEVINLGVLAYSSHQGLALLQHRVLALRPDVVVLSFAMNDGKVAGYRDKDRSVAMTEAGVGGEIVRFMEGSEVVRLLKYLALRLRYRPPSIGYYLHREAASVADAGRRFEDLEPWIRVSPKDYEDNMRRMVQVTRQGGAAAVLLYNELWENSPYREVLDRLSRDEGVPLVDGHALIMAARRKVEVELEHALGLTPAPADLAGADDEIEVRFRVYAGRVAAAKTLYIVGPDPQLGDLIPNKVAMYDDGTHGDQRAGDGVWTYAAQFKRGRTLHYVYTDGGAEGRWEGLDVPHIREFTVEAAPEVRVLYRPIDSFGRIYLQADSWHPDATGYELIAQGVARVLEQDRRFR
jgi:lysophospholipase L1-like esterase